MTLGPSIGNLACLCLAAALGCGAAEQARAREAHRLVHQLDLELRALGQGLASAFMDRQNYEELRLAFGADRFDAGTPMGPEFQRSLERMLGDLNGELDREPLDRDFPRKALRKVEKVFLWWRFARQQLEVRRKALDAPGAAAPSARARVVLDETLDGLRRMEEASQRCLRALEVLVARS